MVISKANEASSAETSSKHSSVAVIVPNYQYKRFIPRCLASISNQTLRPAQVILVDDGSTDGSRDILADWAASAVGIEVLCLMLPENRGKNHALNRAVEMVKSEFTCIVDADDILLPDFLARLLSAIEQNGSDFAYCDNELIDEDDQLLGIGRSCEFNAELIRCASYIPDNGPTRTDLFRTVLPLDETVRRGTKHHRWQRLVAAGAKGHYIDRPLFQYRMHNQNLSGIGDRIKQDLASSKQLEPMLSQYWPLEERKT